MTDKEGLKALGTAISSYVTGPCTTMTVLIVPGACDSGIGKYYIPR